MKIELGGELGGFCEVSEEDYEELSKYSWHETELGYIKGTVNNKKVTMHRFLMKATKDQLVDHINNDRADNRRENLRFCDASQNAHNKKINPNKTSSKFRGVYYNKNTKKYFSKITVKSKVITIGTFATELFVAEAYDMYVVHNKMDFCTLNFEENREGYMVKEFVEPQTTHEKKASEYYGVCKAVDKFRASICIDYKCIKIYHSSDELECANKYDEYVVKNNIPGKKLNFPETYPDYDPNSIIKTKCEIVDDKIVRLLIDDHLDKKPLVDKDIYEQIKFYKCSINGKYVNIMVDKSYQLSRYIMKVTDRNVYVDHINGNKLNNCMNNLRLSNAQQNSKNKVKMAGTLSAYIGARFDKRRNAWSGNFVYETKNKYIGRYHSDLYAARARDLYIIQNYPDDHYKLNFEWTDEDIIFWNKKLLFERNFLQHISDTIKAIDKNEFRKATKSTNKMVKYQKNRTKESIKMSDLIK